jgi:hypothetical protein
MKVITVRNQIRELQDRLKMAWRNPDGTWRRIMQKEPDTEKIHAAVSSLDLEKATINDVTTAVGFNSSWVEEPKCHECNRIVDVAVELGEDPDYESHTATICVKCLRKAISIAARAK